MPEMSISHPSVCPFLQAWKSAVTDWSILGYSRTTKLYDRRGQKVLLEDMERIRY